MPDVFMVPHNVISLYEIVLVAGRSFLGAACMMFVYKRNVAGFLGLLDTPGSC
jgi:hypothetical protein